MTFDVMKSKLTTEQKMHYLTISLLLSSSELYERRVQYALAFALDCIEEKAGRDAP